MPTKKTKTSKRKTLRSKRPVAKTASKKKATAKKKATKRKTTKRATEARKAPKKKTTAKKTTARKAPAAKVKRSPAKKAPPSVLGSRAEECRNVEECRRFIGQLTQAAEEANQWMNDLHNQALDAEQARDLYGEQVAALTHALDADRAELGKLKAKLSKSAPAKPCRATKAVLDTLDGLKREVAGLRRDLEQVGKGRAPSRRRAKQAARTDKVPATAQQVGRFAKYSVIGGAACSLAATNNEDCAPVHFSNPVAATILGKHRQHPFAGLAEWARMTGYPVYDPLNVPRPPTKTSNGAAKSRGRKKNSTRKAPTSKPAAPKPSRGKPGRGKAKRRAEAAASSVPVETAATSTPLPSAVADLLPQRKPAQLLDRLLVTIART
ncbi:MAG: hypothetical protein K0V04_20870 [Deltaproteobacteria bacterium]|nr:hypothetical protein [Deltaproteobacteria bacterium]